MAIGRWFDVLGFGRSQARGDGTLNRRQGRKGRSVARRVSPVRTRRMEQLEDRALLSVTLNSDRLQMTIASNGDTNPGFVTSVKDPATQTEYLNTSVAAPFAKIFSNNSWFNCTSCTFASNTLSFGFANGASLSVDIQQGATDQYLIFSLNTVSLPKPTEIDLLNFQTNLTTYISPLSGMTASNDFAVYFRPLTPYCPTGDCASTVFVANTTNPNYMDSAHMKCALGGSPYGTDGATVRSRLKTLVTNEGLPTSSAGGPYALDTSATINKLSYVFADVTEANVDDWIALAEKYDIGILHFSLGWEASDGHWAVGTSRFSNGLDGMQSVIQKIHDAGLKVGIHTTTIGISPDDSYVTPTPDSRLYKDASFTLATAIPATGAIPTITVNAPIQGIDPTAGNVLQIDNELFQYSGYSDNQFTGCTRQAFNTLPAAHNSGVTVSHLREYYGLFYPDPDSTLVNEIAQNLADIVNTCNIDEVSLDAAEAAPCFAAAKKAIVEKFTHAVRIESSSADIYSWTYLSSFGYTDPPTTADKSVSDLRTAVDANNREAIFMPIDLGSSDFRPSTPSYNAILPDEMEYHCAKTLAIGASYSIDSVHLTPANGRQDDYLAMVKNYQSLMVDSTTKSELLVAGDEFHLETLPDGSLHLVQVQNIGHKVTGISGDGSGTWPVNDPYGTQSPTMRIETLSGVAPYTGTSQQTLAGQSNVSSFLTSSATNVSTPTLSWSTSQVPPVDQDESGSMVFSATNNGTTSQGAWAEASQALLLNASDKGAIGVWIKGDGNGETINIQLCSNSAINEHYVTVDANFTDWRYFELPFSEGDADKYANYVWPYAFDRAVWREPLNLQQITGINIFYNNIPAGGTATCYISTIKALPVSEITLTNPTVTVSGAMVTFPVSMTSGQYIECNSMTDCRLYDKNGFLLQSVTPMGTQPILAQGSNAVSFSATPQSGYNLRANVSMGVSCKQGTQDTSHLAWDAATVGKWDFEDVGGALARDASPYLNHATLSPTVQRVSSKTGFGDALQLNGIDASVNIPASNSLNSLTGSFSVEMWFKYGGSGTAGKSYWTLVNKNATDQSSNDTFHIWVGSNGCLSACVGNGLAYYQLDSNTSVNDGAYHLVDLVYDDVAKGYTLYLDGAIKATRLNLGSTWIVARNTDPVTLGYWQGYANYFNGTIDGVQILSCPLSQAEVTARLSNNLPVVTVTSPTCQSAYMAPTSIPLLATATDSDGLIKKVAFYQGDTWLADGVLQSNNVYAASWANIPATFWGTYAITAKAIDDRETIVSSSIIYVTINATPVINTQPSSQAVDSSSQKATFSVTATGPGTLTYQWKHNGTDIAGANRFYFTVDSPINGDVYRVVVTNSYGSTVSSDATVCSAVAYWKLDDATGTSVADASGNGNTGTFRNGPTWTSGMVNGAIMFDGLNDHITVPDVAALKYAGGELTLSTWAYIDPAETDGGWLISKFWNGASMLNYGVYLGDDYRVSLILQSSDGDWWNHSARLTSSNALSVGTWHHIAFTVDTAQLIKLYVDGILVDSGTRLISTWTDNYDIPLAIGTWYPYGDGWPGITGHSLQGMMDDVCICAHMLTANDIQLQASVPIITPWLATEPANQAVDPGQTATFVVTATGPGNFTYQWQEYEVANSKWSDIVGAIGAYYTPTAAHGDNGLQYRVIVRNCYGGVAISRPARLYVNYGSELWWKLDESSGIAADTDGSGDNYTGTLARSAGWYSTGSIFNGGATFDGDDSCISTPSLAALKYTGGELTLSTWIWGNSSDTNDAVLISKPWDGTGTLFNYQIGYTSGTSSTTGNVFFSLQGSAPAAAYSISSTVGISTGAANDAARHFAGKLDNVRIYRSSLSATDIHRLAIDPPAMASSSKAAQPMGAAILPSSSTTIESTIGKGRCYAVLVGALFQRPTGVLTDVMTRVNNGLSVTKDLVDKLLADKHPRIVDGVSITRGRRIDATFAAVEETLTSDDDAAVESLMDSDFFFPHGLERTRVLTAVDAYFHQGATP